MNASDIFSPSSTFPFPNFSPSFPLLLAFRAFPCTNVSPGFRRPPAFQPGSKLRGRLRSGCPVDSVDSSVGAAEGRGSRRRQAAARSDSEGPHLPSPRKIAVGDTQKRGAFARVRIRGRNPQIRARGYKNPCRLQHPGNAWRDDLAASKKQPEEHRGFEAMQGFSEGRRPKHKTFPHGEKHVKFLAPFRGRAAGYKNPGGLHHANNSWRDNRAGSRNKPEECHGFEAMQGVSEGTLKPKRFGHEERHVRFFTPFGRPNIQSKQSTPRTYACIAQTQGVVKEAVSSEKLQKGKWHGDDWVRKRLCWLFREIPCGTLVGVGRMLNGQKKWIKEEHTKKLIDNLVHKCEFTRAHQVYKWMQRQTWYMFDFELNSKLAEVLVRSSRISHARDLFDEILANSKVPGASTFAILISAYIQQEKSQSINEAYKLYKQMIELYESDTTSSLQEPLFKAVISSLKLPEKAEFLFDGMKKTGVDITYDMYINMVQLYGMHGNQEKIDALRKEMNGKGFPANLDVMNAVLDACALDGNIHKAEETFEALLHLGIEPDWRTYALLIQIYGKANLSRKSLEIFCLMKKNGILPNFSAYEAVIKAMANSLESNHVEKLLKEVEDSGCKPLQPFYTAAMNMYLNLKMYKEVELVNDRIKSANVKPTRAICNALLKSFIQSGQLAEAELLFFKMKEPGGVGISRQAYNIMLEACAVHHLNGKEILLSQEIQENRQTRNDLDEDIQAESNVKMDKISDELREIIAGLLLGGADARSTDNHETFQLHFQFNPERRTSRVLKGHLHELFSRMLKPEYRSGEEGTSWHGRESQELWRLETVSHASFRFYALQYRCQGEPVVPRLLHCWLKPRTLAYWYMYGGFRCQKTGGIVLDSANYSQKEIQHIVKILEVRSSDCKIRKRSTGCSIRFEGLSSSLLWKKMEPHVLEGLKEDLMPCNLSSGIMNTGWENDDHEKCEGDSGEFTEIWHDISYPFNHRVIRAASKVAASIDVKAATKIAS